MELFKRKDITGFWFRLKNVATNLYMRANGNGIETVSYRSGDDKQFRFIKHGKYYNIIAKKTGEAGTKIMSTVASQIKLKLTNASSKNNSDDQYDIKRLSDGNYYIKDISTGKFLQNNSTNAVTLSGNGPRGNKRAKWRFIEVEAIENSNNEKDDMDVFENNTTTVSILNNSIDDALNI